MNCVDVVNSDGDIDDNYIGVVDEGEHGCDRSDFSDGGSSAVLFKL